MAFQPQDFRFKGQVPMAAIMQAYQNKAQQEFQAKQQAEQAKRAKTQETLGIINQASQLVQQGVQMSTARQQKEARNTFASILAKHETEKKFGPTPGFEGEAKAAFTQAYPEQAAPAIAKQLFAGPKKPVTKQRVTVLLDNKPANMSWNPQTEQYTKDGEVIEESRIKPYDPNLISEITPQEQKAFEGLADLIHEGKARPSDITSIRGGNRLKLLRVAQAKYPDLDVSLATERHAIRREFVSGRRGQEAKALDTAILHADKLLDASDAMNKSNIRKYNTLKQWIKREGKGNPELVKTMVMARATARETLRVLQGVGIVTQQEANEMKDDLDVNSSPAEFEGAVDGLFSLMGGRFLTLKSDWKNRMKDVPPPFPIMNKRSQEILKRRGYDPKTMEKTGSTATQGTLGIDQDALQRELKKRGL